VRVKPDAALVETLVYLTEHPTPIVGSFDAEFLALPEEVLVTVMRHHQKYFSVEDEHGKLAPQFVAVMNIPSDPEGFVRSGNERVLRARFNDARFFWQTDQKKSLAARLPDLAHVTFQAKLGTYLEKTERAKALVGTLGGDAHAVRAAELAKCDLTTELVKEFTELQGVVGGLYARAQGEARSRSGRRSTTLQTGEHGGCDTAQPHRPDRCAGRQARHPTRLLRRWPDPHRLARSVRAAARGARRSQGPGGRQDRYRSGAPCGRWDGRAKALAEFLQDRIRYYFKEVRGFLYDEVNAATAAGWSNLVDLEARLNPHPGLAFVAGFRTARREFQAHPQYPRPAEVHRRQCHGDRREVIAGWAGTGSVRRIPAHRRASRLNRWFLNCGPKWICFSTRC